MKKPINQKQLRVKTQVRAGSDSRYLEVNCAEADHKDLCKAYIGCFDPCMDAGGSPSSCKATCDAQFTIDGARNVTA